MSVNFVDKMCVWVVCGVFEIIDSSFIVDVVGCWFVNDNFGLFVCIENVVDSSDIVGFYFYGVRFNRS